MKNQKPTKDRERDQVFNIRVPSTLKVLIDRAASLVNKSRSEFVLEAAYQKAESIITEHTFFALDEERYQQFVDILNSPPKANKVLSEFLRKKSPWEENDTEHSQFKD